MFVASHMERMRYVSENLGGCQGRSEYNMDPTQLRMSPVALLDLLARSRLDQTVSSKRL